MSDTVLSIIETVLPILCAVFGITAMAALVNRHYKTFALGVVTTFLCSVTTVLLPGAVSKEAKSSAPVETSQAPVGGSTAGANHVVWDSSVLVGVLVVLAIAVVLGAIIVGMIFTIPHLKKAAHTKSENINAWKDLVKRHDEVRAQWAAYEIDMSKLINMPVMTDMREPVIIALHKALKTASSLAPKSLDKLAFTSLKDSAFLAAVNDLEIAFNTAEQTAKKIAWSKFTKEERRSLSTAKQLLSLAMDAGASPAERQSAYKRVFKELQGLIEFPEKARLELETRHQLSLAA